MPGLIPAQVIAEMLDQQNPQPTQASPQAMAGIFHPAMQLQMAQALRQRQQGTNGQPALGNAPLADHVRQAKVAGTQGTPQAAPVQHDFGGQPQQQQQNPNAGTMSVAASGHNPMSAQGMYDWAKRVKHDQQAQGNNTYTPNVQAGPDVYNPQTDANKESLIHQMFQRGQGAEINNMVPGPNRVQGFSVGGHASGAPGGAGAVTDGGQQPQADPTVQMLNAFKGHVPDHLLTAAQQAINAGMKPAEVFGHLQTAAQQQGKPAKDEGEGERKTMLQAKLHHLETQEKEASDHGEDPGGYEKQIQDTIGQLGPQQTAAPAATPQKGQPLPINQLPPDAQKTLHQDQAGNKIAWINNQWTPVQ